MISGNAVHDPRAQATSGGQSAQLQPSRSIFEFTDYRRYLKYHFIERRGRDSPATFLRFAKLAGLGTSAGLKSVIGGRRDLALPRIGRCCHALKLGPREAKYFSNLVRFNQARTAREKQRHYSILRYLGSPAFEEGPRGDQYNYFDRWHIPVIRDLICREEFREDWESAGRSIHPPISALEAQNAARMLRELGLVTRSRDGRYAPNGICQTGPEGGSDPGGVHNLITESGVAAR